MPLYLIGPFLFLSFSAEAGFRYSFHKFQADLLFPMLGTGQPCGQEPCIRSSELSDHTGCEIYSFVMIFYCFMGTDILPLWKIDTFVVVHSANTVELDVVACFVANVVKVAASVAGLNVAASVTSVAASVEYVAAFVTQDAASVSHVVASVTQVAASVTHVAASVTNVVHVAALVSLMAASVMHVAAFVTHVAHAAASVIYVVHAAAAVKLVVHAAAYGRYVVHIVAFFFFFFKFIY